MVKVDDRESSGAVRAALESESGVQVRVERLPVGDYLIDGSLLFERKTLIDLVQSIKDGRLFSQGARLAASPVRGALILEGTSRDLDGSQMSRDAIQGALICLTLFFGIPLLRALDPLETARLMLLSACQARRLTTGAYPRQGRRPRGKRQLQHYILQGLPGIGPRRAKYLLDRFGSVEAVIAAESDALAEVEGIGPATAEAIRWAVREPPGTFVPGEDPFFI